MPKVFAAIGKAPKSPFYKEDYEALKRPDIQKTSVKQCLVGVLHGAPAATSV
jgi:hypothetical protein